jgi:transcriptional regulator with XRE-family HTH domain
VITFSNTWNKLRDKKYREAFVFQAFKRIVPFQISAMRKQRGWSQETLARNANVTQGVVSRAEDPDYGNLTIKTICRIAAGFDVAFIGKFVPFSELDRWFTVLSQESGIVPSFEQENAEMGKVESIRYFEPRLIIKSARPTPNVSASVVSIGPFKAEFGRTKQRQAAGRK